MKFLNKNKNKGFVILFAVVLVSIILSVTLSLSDITFKELSFSTQAHNTNEAFFAANTGAECALFYNNKGKYIALNPDPNYGIFGTTERAQCGGSTIPLDLGTTGLLGDTDGPWVFVLSNLGSSGKGCAYVRIEKTISPDHTKIISKGYSHAENLVYDAGGNIINCTSNNPNKVEREIEINFNSL